MIRPQFFVVPITHIDLAWKRGREEMAEMLEIAVVQILDGLESDPDFKYQLEQAAHFRELGKKRPDLIARLQPFLSDGRLEFVGGMASTLETNGPNGECLLRNQQMGLEWVRRTWNVPVSTAWLIDTFGLHAQMPQILRGFGFDQLMANRFGGAHTDDLFRARGLDGSEITVAGWGTYSAHMKRENLAERFVKTWDDSEILFEHADALSGPGPFMVIPYTENEMLISRQPAQIAARRNLEPSRKGQSWQIATPREYFAALSDAIAADGRVLPVAQADLNPEFTGCFSLRPTIRTRNRRVETRLLEAEKWAALAALSARGLEEAWWQLHFVQFHDVFTGSHPTPVFREVMAILDEIERTAEAVLSEAFGILAPPIPQTETANETETADETEIANETEIALFNGLPWNRREVVEVPLPPGFEGVSGVRDADGCALPFEVRGERVRFGAALPAVGAAGFALQKGPRAPICWRETETARLENPWIRLDFDTRSGLAELVWKPTGRVLLQGAGSWLVLQSDSGNFQIENPNSAEVPVSLGAMRLEIAETEPGELGQTVRLSGEFPRLAWMKDGFLRFQAEWFLPAERAEIRLRLGLDWQGEAARVRLSLPTTLDTSAGIFEIPFGVVTRRPYSPRINARGEWPAHRWVALESDGYGLALANTGVAGVEVVGGTLFTTLLRAPQGEYAGMVADATSSAHGHHDFEFALVPYAGNWADAGVAAFAQELNNPVSTCARTVEKERSWARIEPATVVLSGIKAAQDDSGALIVRVYETAGRATDAMLHFPGATRICHCDLNENPGAKLEMTQDVLHFSLQPFEIRSFRVRRETRSG